MAPENPLAAAGDQSIPIPALCPHTLSWDFPGLRVPNPSLAALSSLCSLWVPLGLGKAGIDKGFRGFPLFPAEGPHPGQTPGRAPTPAGAGGKQLELGFYIKTPNLGAG